jgi:hypothetical protein
MKKLLCGLVLMIISYGGFAQMSKKMHDCYVMKDGKVMKMKGGKEMMVDKTMTLKNGEMIMQDGTVKMKDGSTKMLKEGEYIDMNGKTGMMNESKMDKMDKMDKMKTESGK